MIIINSEDEKKLVYRMITREKNFAYSKVFQMDTEKEREQFYGIIDACSETMDLINQGHSLKDIIKISEDKKANSDNDHYIKGIDLVLKIIKE
ncbi:MAG: hypothetical protein ACOCUI_05270 [bacterium]